MDSAKVIYYLDLWRDYMKHHNSGLGYKTRSTGFNTGGVHSFDDLGNELDGEAARIVEKAIDDLPSMQKQAIYVVYLTHKATMDTKVLEYYYDSALRMLQKKLKEKNLY